MARLNIIDITGNTWNIDPISGNKLFSALLSYLEKKKTNLNFFQRCAENIKTFFF